MSMQCANSIVQGHPTGSRDTIVSGAFRVSVVAAGKGWLVITKPSGMSVHNNPGKDLCSVVRAAVRQCRLPILARVGAMTHPVHRLDRDTSGIVLLAGSQEMLAFFGQQFAARTVQKTYLAVVHGHLKTCNATASWNTWNVSLTPDAAGRRDPRGRGQRVASETRWRVIQHTPHYSLVACQPLTGRKHQLRRHAKLAGHPVIGDRRYGSTRSRAYLSRQYGFNRLGLHAHALTICLPGQSDATTFRSSGLPQAMRQLLEQDRSSGRLQGT